jgi:hypothetical protein
MACWFSAPDWFGLRAWSAVSQHAKAKAEREKKGCVGEKEEQCGNTQTENDGCVVGCASNLLRIDLCAGGAAWHEAKWVSCGVSVC